MLYPLCVSDGDGQLLRGEHSYVLRFARDELDRFALGDRDAPRFNADGSLDLYIQHANPGVDKESNWLPAPASGVLGVTMRLYAPRPEGLDGRWNPPAILRTN